MIMMYISICALNFPAAILYLRIDKKFLFQILLQ